MASPSCTEAGPVSRMNQEFFDVARRKRRIALVGFLLVVSLLVGHAIHDGHNGRGNPFVWLFGRLSFSVILYFHPYYQVKRQCGS